MTEVNLDLLARQAIFAAAETADRFAVTGAASTDAAERAADAQVKSAAAVVTADAATTTAGTANTKADSAVATANAASTAAGNAVTTANAASSTAGNALSVANGIDAKATTALSNSSAAVSTANGIDAKATTALSNSSAAVTTANAASTAVAGKVGVGDSSTFTGTNTFNGPTTHNGSTAFAGAVTGLTKSMVGLGNVDNLSRASILASPAITGTPTGLLPAHVGLGNVANLAPADLPVSTATFNAMPRVYMKVWRSVDQPLSPGTATAILYDGISANVGSYYNPASARFTPQKAGWWLLVANALINSGGDMNHTTASIMVNGQEQARFGMHYAPLSGHFWWGAAGSLPVFLNGTTDYAHVQLMVNTTQGYGSAAFGGFGFNTFSAIYMGT
jgi:hypothetical protein